jgi:hypothetical protein
LFRKSPDKVSAIMLSASLVKFTFEKLITSPFSFLHKRLNHIRDQQPQQLVKCGNGCRCCLENGLKRIWEEVVRCKQQRPAPRKERRKKATDNPAEGHAWRSQLFRHLDPKFRLDHHKPNPWDETKQITQAVKDQIAIRGKEEFLRTDGQCFIANINAEDIFRKAVELSYKIWVQKIY